MNRQQEVGMRGSPWLWALGLALLVAAPATAGAQVTSATANPQDVGSIDAIIAALYESISGPPGHRDWPRFHSLFLPGAILMNAGARPDTLPPPAPLGPAGYRERVIPYFMRNPFFEDEIARRVDRFGTVAHVWSTYASREAPGAEPFQRGINSIQLVRHRGRWWITSVVWDAESQDQPIPEQYLRTPAGPGEPDPADPPSREDGSGASG